MATILEMHQVHKIYNPGKANEVHALRGVDLVVESGTSLAIMGVSGSGKSTLLNIVGCMDGLSSGTMTLCGKDVFDYSAYERGKLRGDKIGFVMQDYGLLADDTVEQNVLLPLYFSDKFKSVKEKKARITQVLTKLGIIDLRKRKVKNLSGGQRQRTAIARAIANDPAIILADEPTGALDSKTAEEMMQVFRQLQQEGKTILMVTHDAKMAAYMDRTMYIHDGVLTDEPQ